MVCGHRLHLNYEKITEFLLESNLDIRMYNLNILFICSFIHFTTNLLYNHSQYHTGPAYGGDRQTQT